MNINENFIIDLQGKKFVTYEGLLDLAHQHNLNSIYVELLQIPNEKNNMTAICKATATTDKSTFTDIGDASPKSVNANVAPHLIRIASTRAKARVLRDLTNIGMTALEEINTDEIENETNNIDFYLEEPATQKQVETIKKLSNELDLNIPLETLTKKAASTLISKMINERNKKH